MDWDKPVLLKPLSAPEERKLTPEENDAIMRAAAARVFLPKRIARMEAPLRKLIEVKYYPKGFEGLKQKKRSVDLDKYNLTERQHDVMSLRLEYEIPKIQIAHRLRIHRSTVDGHITAAGKRIEEHTSRVLRSKRSPLRPLREVGSESADWDE